MVLKCTFSFPREKKQELIARVNMLPALADSIVQKRSIITHADQEGRISVTVLYEFEDPRVMEVFREIFAQRDIFAGISGVIFSAEFCREGTDALKGSVERFS